MVKISVACAGKVGEEAELLLDQLLLELLASAGVEEEDIVAAKTTAEENYVVLNEKGVRKLAEHFLSAST